MNDWVILISDMSRQNRWLASSKRQQISKQVLNSVEKSSNKSTGNKINTKTQAQVTFEPSNFMMSGVEDYSHEKCDMAVEILVGDKSMTKTNANRRLSTLKEKTRETLGAYTGLTSKQGKDKKI